jgi:DNA-binding NarL/FixJ family response regulator
MLGDGEDIKRMQKEIKNAFKAVKEEMNMHLDTINQNSTDVQLVDEKTDERLAEMREYFNERLSEMREEIEKLKEIID